MSIAYTIKQLLESGYPATLPPFATQAEMYAFAATQKRSLSATLIDLMALGMSPLPQFDFTTTTTLDPRIAFSRPTLGTRYNVDGSIVTEAANVPRFDYDPVTHAARGLLIEPQRTNLIQWSEDTSKSPPWIRQNINVATSADAMSVRGITLQKMTASTAEYARVTHTFGNVDAGATAQISVYAVAGTSPQTQLRIDTGSNSAYVLFNWAGGVPSTASVAQGGSFSAGVASFTDLGGGLYRLALSATNTSGAIFSEVNARYYTQQGSGAVGNSVYYGGFQAEISTSVTSYIPTTNAQVTRAADIAQVTLPQPSDVLVQDRNGGTWITAVPAGPYTLTPRANQRHITRWRAFPVGYAAANAAMAVAY